METTLDGLCEQGAYAQALELVPRDAPGRGEVLYWMGRPEARATLQGLTGPAARLAEARCCWQADLYEEGLALLERVPASPERELTRALILVCQGRGEQAEPLLQAALPPLTGHRRLRAQFDLGVSWEFAGQPLRASEHFQQAADGWRQISPRHPELVAALFGLAGVQQKLGRPEVRPTCEEFLALVTPEDPRWPAMAEALALHLLEERDWAKLAPRLAELWHHAPRGAIAYMLAVAHSHLDQLDLARDMMETAHRLFETEGQPEEAARARANLARLTEAGR